MKQVKKQFLFIVIFSFSLVTILIRCAEKPVVKGEGAAKEWFYACTDSLLQQLSKLEMMLNNKTPIAELRSQFAECRLTYKKIEGVTEYYFQGLVKRINGSALPDIKPEDGQVWPPHGFQVMEQYIFGEWNDSFVNEITNEIRMLQTDLRFVKTNMEHHAILPHHLQEIIQHQFIRIATLGISGFDAPVSKLSIKETEYALQGILSLASAYSNESNKIEDEREVLLDKAINYLKGQHDFDSFDRMEFLLSFLSPLSQAYYDPSVVSRMDSIMTKPFRGTLAELLKGEGFDPDYYAGYASAKSEAGKVALGKQLFFDKQLSRSGTISCASCHQPARYFADGKTKADNFVHGGSLLRNTPTLYYASLQSHQFYDHRAVTLEDQADDVMKSGSEFNFTSASIARKMQANEKYDALFRQVFNIQDTISSYEVRNAIAAFVRSLNPFSSQFDEYMKGDKGALTPEQIRGFNLFMGKAKCGTCHFMPLFNGNIPPWYAKSESEVIGVPSRAIWENAETDSDSGRYRINQIKELMFAFKTPTVRNSAETSPYMHNGVYRTLEEVVRFYNEGGGVGIGIELAHQTLPFDSLSLNQAEQKAIVSFMRALTDRNRAY